MLTNTIICVLLYSIAVHHLITHLIYSNVVVQSASFALNPDFLWMYLSLFSIFHIQLLEKTIITKCFLKSMVLKHQKNIDRLYLLRTLKKLSLLLQVFNMLKTLISWSCVMSARCGAYQVKLYKEQREYLQSQLEHYLFTCGSDLSNMENTLLNFPFCVCKESTMF